MSWIKRILNFINARRHPDEVTREVETELRFHIEMRTRANIKDGMKADDAQTAAVQSFGDFERVKNSCCEIRRSLPFDSMPLKMGLHITIAVLAGLAALWAVNVPHHNFTGVMRQLIAIIVLAYLFIVVRRAKSQQRSDSEYVSGALVTPSERFRANQNLTSDMSDASSGKITAYDEQGRTPVERMFKS
jgi:hypothetical protein